MKIHALTVCVNYADWLAIGIDRWLSGVASLTVVTDTKDRATPQLCQSHSVRCFRTDAFYRDGAKFNKGRAICEAFEYVPKDDWILFFDSDICPPKNWRSQIVNTTPGNLYGSRRYQCEDVNRLDDEWKIIGDGDCPGVGFFQLFHSTDPNAQVRPIVDDFWMHAGCYDSTFMHRWPDVKCLPLKLIHVGERENWFGRGNRADFEAMQSERKKRKGYQHERICAS